MEDAGSGPVRAKKSHLKKPLGVKRGATPIIEKSRNPKKPGAAGGAPPKRHTDSGARSSSDGFRERTNTGDDLKDKSGRRKGRRFESSHIET